MKCELKNSTIKKGEETVTDYLKPACYNARSYEKKLYIASKHKKLRLQSLYNDCANTNNTNSKEQVTRIYSHLVIMLRMITPD